MPAHFYSSALVPVRRPTSRLVKASSCMELYPLPLPLLGLNPEKEKQNKLHLQNKAEKRLCFSYSIYSLRNFRCQSVDLL